ncbi:serine/threonine-protein kinase [Acidobacteriota bacterium]
MNDKPQDPPDLDSENTTSNNIVNPLSDGENPHDQQSQNRSSEQTAILSNTGSSDVLEEEPVELPVEEHDKNADVLGEESLSDPAEVLNSSSDESVSQESDPGETIDLVPDDPPAGQAPRATGEKEKPTGDSITVVEAPNYEDSMHQKVARSTIGPLQDEDMDPQVVSDVIALREPDREERYHFEKKLGQGGMGKVYLAQDKDLKRPVAIKIILSDNNELKARFLDEAQVMGQLDHPNILSVHELGLTPSKKLYYTMPLVQGTTLQDILKGLKRGNEEISKTYSLARLVQIFLHVTQAMQFAHSKGVIHRDLKPANIMLGEHGEIQVLDWGLAKVIEKGKVETDRITMLTRVGQIMGTPTYMSPEQAAGQEAGMMSDIYALGVILYEMLTFNVPFEGHPMEVLTAHLAANPEAPSARTTVRRVPPSLERTCLKAIAKEQKMRHQSMKELHDEVRDWLEVELDVGKPQVDIDSKVLQGEKKLTAITTLQAKLGKINKELARHKNPAQAGKSKYPIKNLKHHYRQARARLITHSSDMEEIMIDILGVEGEHQRARKLLAAYYRNLHEYAKDAAERQAYGILAKRYGNE